MASAHFYGANLPSTMRLSNGFTQAIPLSPSCIMRLIILTLQSCCMSVTCGAGMAKPLHWSSLKNAATATSTQTLRVQS